MPAEWEEHEATWLGWPHNREDWPGKFATIPWVFGEIVRKLVPDETVRVIVASAAHQQSASRVLIKAGVDISRVEFFRFPTDRPWARDCGPIFLRRDGGGTSIAGFRFNGWAKYANWKKDARVPERAAAALGYQIIRAEVNGKPFVLEGGAIDVNGKGSLLTTEECQLDQHTQVRNPGLTREGVEQALRSFLSLTNILWLGRGIAGDDTHGHVDDCARFVNARTIVACVEQNATDQNYVPLEENRERLQGMRLEDGSRPEVILLPMPSPLTFAGIRLPASYANFYIANAAVLVPTFNDPRDRTALGVLSELFTDRPVLGIHAVDLAWGFGTLHCLTQQQPAAHKLPRARV